MHTMIKRTAAGAVLGGSLLATGGLGIANAVPPVNPQSNQVDIAVGAVTVARGVNASAAGDVVTALCGNAFGVDVNALANQVVQTGTAQTVGGCFLPGGPVSVTQSAGINAGNTGTPSPLSQEITPGQSRTQTQLPGEQPSGAGQQPAQQPVTPIG
jgi:hypothetical protein